MKKSIFKTLVLVLFLFSSMLIIGCSCNETPYSFISNVTIEQKGQEQNLVVNWETDNAIDKITIEVKHNNEIVTSKTITTAGEILKGSTEIGAYYGKHTVVTNIYSKKAVNTDTKEITVSADEYNIAPLSGSLPVLMFTLSSLQDDGLMVNSNNEKIPTFVWLDRAGAYDWTKLPDGIYPMPNASVEDYTTPNVNRNLMYDKTNEYIKELISINSNSKFNLFLNDYDTDQYLKLLVANGVSEENYVCTFISDGSHSYATINNTYNIANATEKYNSMVNEFNATKQEVKTKHYYDYNTGFTVNGQDLRNYLLVMANEDANVRWWFPRLRSNHINLSNDTTNLTANKIINDSGIVCDNIKEYGINTFLTKIQQSSEKVSTLKSLYKFNDDMFEKAKLENKKVMMLLGSWATNQPEQNFVDYVNFVKTYYGDDYVYYYKGHPNSPTGMYPERAQLIEDLGLIDIESTIAAELILFYFPDIYMSGYSSSTFNSIKNPEMACAYWGTDKQTAINSPNIANGEMFDVFITPATDTYSSILIDGHTSYLVELMDTTNYDFGIYDATDNQIRYYKNNGGSFELV